MTTFHMLLQTAAGIDDPAAWFTCSLYLSGMSRGLLLSLVNYGDGLPEGIANCQTYVDAFHEVFGARFGLSVRAGHLGLPKVNEGRVVFCEHAWLVAASAPDWVIDIVPCNGLMAPLIVNVREAPWVGLYRSFVSGERLPQSAAQVKFRQFLVSILRALDDPESTRQLV